MQNKESVSVLGSIFSKEEVIADIEAEMEILNPTPEHEKLIREAIDKNLPSDGTEETEKLRIIIFELGVTISSHFRKK